MTFSNELDYFHKLETESIYLIREAYFQTNKSVILFSGGKDSVVLAHLAMKAFAPMGLPIPLLHIDTGHNFDETIKFRDYFVSHFGLELKVYFVEDSIKNGNILDYNEGESRNSLQSITLSEAIQHFEFDVVFGGARRDEEKARAKERFCSLRKNNSWNPNNQRPELWDLFNFSKADGEHFRVFPLSNWTEEDILNYIRLNKLQLSSLYYAHEREVVDIDGTLLFADPDKLKFDSKDVKLKSVRFRTVGDITCSGAIESHSKLIEEIIQENKMLHSSERGARADDKLSDSAMEDRKKKGYF